MEYSMIPPCRELKEVVSHFWVATWDKQAQSANETYYVIASSLTEITFAFSGPGQQDQLLFSAIQGHTHLPDQLPVDSFHQLIGVSLHSYAIPILFGFPPYDLNQEFLALTTFLGQDGKMLNEKMALAQSTECRIRILSNYLKCLLSNKNIKAPLMTSAIQQVKRSDGNTKVIDLAGDAFLSTKQFNRRFRDFSGFTPKMYARIIRFESAIRSYAYFSNLTEVAHHSGYYDQAHFIREFKAFTGFNPTTFWKLSEQDP